MTKSLFTVLFFATTVFAQSVLVGLPTDNQTVTAGSLVVQIQRPDTLTGSEEVAVVIGLQSCVNLPCYSPSSTTGTVLYNGPFDPQFYEPHLPPYQNFTVQVPSSISAGPALIGVLHLTLVGVVLYPLLEAVNQTIILV